ASGGAGAGGWLHHGREGHSLAQGRWVQRGDERCRRQGGARPTARCELEGPNASLPVKRTVSCQVFVRVPESAVIGRVDAHTAVVTPATASVGLRSCAFHDAVLALHRARWIGGHAARITNSREIAAAGSTVSHSNVTRLIHRDRAHPAVLRVG